MRCLNCGTLVADSDRSCRSCGSTCTTPVSAQTGPPVPIVGGILLFVCWFAYPLMLPLMLRHERPIHDREVIEQHKLNAKLCALAGAFLGSIVDGLLWRSRRRRNSNGETQVAQFGPNLNAAFRQPGSRVPGNVPLQTAQSQPMPPSSGCSPRVPGNVPLQTLAALGLQSSTQQQPSAAGQWEEPSRQRSVLVRVIFGLVWAVVFFLAAALISSSLAISGAGNDPERQKQLTEEAARKYGLVSLLGSIALAFVLGKLGLLPGTRRTKR